LALYNKSPIDGVVLTKKAINSDDKINEIPIVQQMLKNLNI